MGWTGCQGELEMSLEACVLAALGLHGAHDSLPVLALWSPWHHGGTCGNWAGVPCEIWDGFSSPRSLGMGVIKASQLSHAPAQRLKPSRWISCASLMMAICVQEPEYCFLPSVSLEIFDGIEIIGTSLECLNCSLVLAGTAWWPGVWPNVGGHQLESALIPVSLVSGS